MALQKTSRWAPALVHGLTYTLPFLFATQSFAALLVIGLTHAVIDRYRLAKYLVWFKNQFAPKAFRPDRESMKTTGYPTETPIWLSTWLLFIADNTVHIIINTLAIIFLGHIGVLW